MNTKTPIWMGGVLMALFCGGPNAAELTLVAEGKPNAVIVATVEPHAAMMAAEIQKYIEKMSGAKLPIMDEAAADVGGTEVKIFVGHTKAAAANGVTAPSGFKEVVGDPRVFEEEGFVIKTKGNQIFIGGNSDGPYRGTIYGGYDFLERLGCRWYFPGEWGEVVPEKKTVTFPETDVQSKPDFALREQNLGGWFPSSREEQHAYAEWGKRIKYNDYSRFYPGVGDGFFGFLLPPKEYPNQPDLYAMDKFGSRKQPDNFLNGVMLSFVNPKTYELAVANLKQAFEGNLKKSAIGRIIGRNGFGISPPDGPSYDFDPKAVEQNGNFNYPAYIDHPMVCEEFFGFAARLAKEFPDKWVSTMAYAGREMPPQGVKLPPNVAVMYAPIASCVCHAGSDPACWRRTETMEILREWLTLTPHVFMYDYNPGFLLGSFVPERDVANFAINAKLYKDLKMKGFCTEGRKTFMITWISYYMRGKLMWDATADVEALKKDFYNTFFGPEAGPFVQQWWDECEKALGAATIHCHEDWLANHVYTVAFTSRIHEYVDKASKCTMTPKQKEHFNAFALIADHLEAIAERDAAEMNLDYAKAINQAQRAEDDDARLTAIYSFFIGPKVHPDFNNGFLKRFRELANMTTGHDIGSAGGPSSDPNATSRSGLPAATDGKEGADGKEGRMIAPVPLEAKFARDRFNEGVVGEWYLAGFDDSKWGMENTFVTWRQQDKPEDAKGHEYNGYGWYRFTLDVPADMANKPLNLHLGGVINEGWVWINGEYAGHRGRKLWWEGRKGLEMDVDATGKIKAGTNVIAVRVWNNADSGGGLLRRGFLWAPKEQR